MSKLKTILSKVNKHLEAASIGEMRIDIARETLLNDHVKEVKKPHSPRPVKERQPLFDELPMIGDKKAYSNT